MQGSSPPAEQYVDRLESFAKQAVDRGLADVSGIYWYHTVDLGGGLVTPGMYDYRPVLANFCLPDDMAGMKALDVGPATGYFSFEFERRGALVTGIEVPSIDALDRFPGQSTADVVENILSMLQDATVPRCALPGSSAELYDRLLKRPFEVCKEALGSAVERRFTSIHELTPSTAGGSEFDLVFLGDILLHTIDPLGALAKAANLCSGTLVVAQAMPDLESDLAAFLYVGGEASASDSFSWWVPTRSCLIQLLRKLGFREVRDVGRHTGQVFPGGHFYDRRILHAVRG